MKANKLLIIPAALVTTTLLTGAVLTSTITKADGNTSSSDAVSITVDSACTMTGGPTGESTTDNTYTATIDPGTYSEISGSKLVTLCNDSEGYSIYAIGFSGDSYDTDNTKLLGQGTISGTNINTGTSGTNSYWAMKLQAVEGLTPPTIETGWNDYHVIPDTYTQIAEYANSTTSPSDAGASVQTKYKVNISSSQTAGSYQGKVKYTMVHPNNAPEPVTPPASCTTPISNITYMQDINPSNQQNILSSMTEDAQYYLIDKRDNKPYCVSKLKDGHIWMTQNLNLAGGTTLRHSDSNVTSDYTLPMSDNSGFDDEYNAQLYNSGNTDCATDTPCYSYYNQIAAIADTNNPGVSGSDICPSGWRLPINTEFSDLISNYASENSLINNPFMGVYAGYYDYGEFNDGGLSGNYWSSKGEPYGDENYIGFYLWFNGSSAGVDGRFRQYGHSIRCIQKDFRTLTNITYMQDMTPEIAHNTSDGSTATLIDRRDGKEYTVAKIGDALWMTKNLDLAGGTTLEHTLTNVPEGYSTTTAGFTNGDTLPISLVNPIHNWQNDREAVVYNSGSTICDDAQPCYSYYSWMAASAGYNSSYEDNYNVKYDICPSGWQLPRRGSLERLKNTYPTTTALTAPPFSGVYAGHYEYYGLISGGNGGGYWSAYSPSGTAYYLSFWGDSVSVSNYIKSYGYAVRCTAQQ